MTMAEQLKEIMVGADMIHRAAQRGRELRGHDNPPANPKRQAERIAAIAEGACYTLRDDDDCFEVRRAFAKIAEVARELQEILR